MNRRRLTVEQQSWKLENEFRISRGARTQADVVVVTINEENFVGRSEVVPTAHYDETIESVMAQLSAIKPNIESGLSIDALNLLLSPGAARNALDCALWDLKARKEGSSVAKLTHTQPFEGCETAQTISVGCIDDMTKSAKALHEYPLIKIKLDAIDVVEKMSAIAHVAPKSRFIIDANEAWTLEQLNQFSRKLADCNIALIEQPLPAAEDSVLTGYTGEIPLCADESIHTCKDLERVSTLYHYINIKLDKTGGLTEALKLLHQAKSNNIGIMIGCMVGTSLAMAPAALLAQYAEFVDLDGPTLLAKDRDLGFKYAKGKMQKSEPELWGGPYKPAHADRSYRYFHSGR